MRTHQTSRFASLAVTILVLASWPASAAAYLLEGKVVRVSDGDTITLLVQQQQHRVRLAEIDAPEAPGQPFNEVSRQHLASLISGQLVQVRVVDTDRYGRAVGHVYHQGRSANAEMVRAGLAWVNPRYSRDPKLQILQAEARAARRGLWRDPAPVPPWEWRRAHPK